MLLPTVRHHGYVMLYVHTCVRTYVCSNVRSFPTPFEGHMASISGGLVYLFAMPLKQVYWGGERQDGVGREQPRRGTWECPVTADRSQGPMAGSHPPLPPPLPPLLVPPPTNCASRTLLLQCMPG